MIAKGNVKGVCYDIEGVDVGAGIGRISYNVDEGLRYKTTHLIPKLTEQTKENK